MTSLIDDYLRQVGDNLRATGERKREILDELRSHLSARVDDAQRAFPARLREDIEREVLRDFGNPHDLAVAYDPDGPVLLTNSTGEVVLRIGRAAARGTAQVLKWLAIGFAGFVLLAIVVGVWAFYEVRPYVENIVEENLPQTVYSYHESCDRPCGGPMFNETFYVHPEARDVRLDLTVRHLRHPADGAGNVTVLVRAPDGSIHYNRTFVLADDTHASYETRWAPVVGDWTVAYRFEDFVGVVDVEMLTTGLRLPG